MDKRFVFFKHKIVPVDQANVSVLSPTAQFAVNVFEGIRGYWDRESQSILLFRLDEHLERLKQSCSMLNLKIPYDVAQLKHYIRKTIVANHYAEDIALRLIVFIDGEGSWSSQAPADIVIAPIQMPRCSAATRSPLRAMVSSWRRIDDLSLPPRIKCGANYVNGRYAQLDAQSKGFDVPIFLGGDGKISEAPGSCIFIVKDGVLLTPPTTSSILDSITRDTILQLAKENSIPFDVRPIDRSELLLASEAFLCGSSAEISPIGSVDQMILGNGSVGNITHTVSDLYFEAVCNSKSQGRNWTETIKLSE